MRFIIIFQALESVLVMMKLLHNGDPHDVKSPILLVSTDVWPL
jgi:hypothetical protein